VSLFHILTLIIAAIPGWQLIQGFRTGVMQWGTGVRSFTCELKSSPFGFWGCALGNLIFIAALVYISLPRG
jgi:formate hydrogenlyase subunit 3/multisubunit Na+/H+ antiporter MnhD subunit